MPKKETPVAATPEERARLDNLKAGFPVTYCPPGIANGAVQSNYIPELRISEQPIWDGSKYVGRSKRKHVNY